MQYPMCDKYQICRIACDITLFITFTFFGQKRTPFFFAREITSLWEKKGQTLPTYKRYVFYVSGKSPNLHRHTLILTLFHKSIQHRWNNVQVLNSESLWMGRLCSASWTYGSTSMSFYDFTDVYNEQSQNYFCVCVIYTKRLFVFVQAIRFAVPELNFVRWHKGGS